jgi:hypothetical protein
MGISMLTILEKPREKRTHEGLVGTSTTSNDTDHTTDAAENDLLGSGWELDAGLALIRVVSNNGNVVSGSASKSTTVTDLLLNVGDDGTLGDGADWENVSDGQSSVLAGVDELAGVHALVGDEGLGLELESVWVAENDLGKRRTTSGVVDDVLDNAANVSVTLSIIEVSELCRCLVQAGIRRENGAAALPLVANNSSHFVYVSKYSMSCECKCLLLLTRLVGGRRRCRWWSSRLRKGKTLNI